MFRRTKKIFIKTFVLTLTGLLIMISIGHFDYKGNLLEYGDFYLLAVSGYLNKEGGEFNYIPPVNMTPTPIYDGDDVYFPVEWGNKEHLIKKNQNNQIFLFPRLLRGRSADIIIFLSRLQDATDDDITGGLRIAGTGEVTIYGGVAGVNGVNQKVDAALNAGVDIIFIPDINVVSTDSPKIVPVGNVWEVIEYLERGF